MSGYIPGVVIAALFIVLIMAYVLYLEDKSEKLQLARKRSCRGIISVLESCPEDSECASQIQMLYKRLSEQYSSLNENFRSATEMIEDLICSVDTTDQVEFKKTFGVELPIQLRSRIIKILDIMKHLQPFSSISSKEGNLLNMLKHAIDTQNSDLAKNTLNQLADEIEVLEGNLRKQFKRTNYSFAISAMGVILTIFFGVVAFIQFIAK